MELHVSDETKKNLMEKNTWSRGLYMLLFIVVDSFVRLAIQLIALVQFVLSLVTSGPNPKLVELGQSLSKFAFQIMMFVTYNANARPYPFDEVWPVADPVDQSAKPAKSKKAKQEKDD
jgi:hypothetical protein